MGLRRYPGDKMKHIVESWVEVKTGTIVSRNGAQRNDSLYEAKVHELLKTSEKVQVVTIIPQS